MRVAIVTESFLPTLNGVTTSVCRVSEQLYAGGHDVRIVAPAPAPDRFGEIRVATCPSVSVRQFPTGLPTPGLRQALEDFAPEVVHVASPFVLGARALQWADRTQTPAVAIYQTDVPSYLAQHTPGRIGTRASNAAWRWIRRMHAHADLTLAPSSATIEELRHHGIPRVERWRRGVDHSLFSPRWRGDAGARELRRALSPAGEVLIGYVGRLAPEKELHRLAEAATIPGTRLVIVGDGPARSEVGALLTEAVADMPGRPNRTPIFLGQRRGDDLARAYAAFDVFVHTGTRETFGQTLQEAAAMGLPVVAPARGGPIDLVDHGRSGYLFDPDRPGALREAAATLVADPQLRASMGEVGLARIAQCSWGALTAELVGHYERARVTRRARAPHAA
ncbi:MAG: glycosyltransferase family 1 protein [Dermatophilaceae bacterium]|jgi:phosphatidylinositol alpha 1,6-mannosyltransferase